MQLMVFVFLPSILLSGFMFPFDGMPRAARLIGELLPLTHFMRLVRGILLRGATIAEVQADVWPLVAFSVVMLGSRFSASTSASISKRGDRHGPLIRANAGASPNFNYEWH